MSTFANVYVGSAPNDLTGDTLREAFQIINLNFANIAAGNANITINSPVRSVAGRTGNVLLTVNDVMGAASNAWVNAQTTAANAYANVLYATTTSNITNNVYAQVSANLASNIAQIASDLITSGNLLTPVYASISTTNANVAAANIRIQNIEANLGGVNTSVTSLVAANIALNANLGTATTNISTLLANSATQAVDIATNTNRSAAANIIIAGISANLGTISTTVVQLVANAATQDASLTSLIANSAVQADALASLVSNSAVQATQIRTLDANLGTATTNITSLVANSAVQAAEILAMIGNSATQGSQIFNINSLLIIAQNDIDAIQTNVAILQDNLPSVVALQANDAVQATQIRTLDANLGTATTNIATGYTDANALRANITAANAAIVTANTGLKSYVDNQITVTNSAWTANATTQSVQIAVLNANLGTATTNIVALFNNAAAQTDLITLLDANITAANIESGRLRANVTAANVEILNLQSNLSAANLNIVTNTNQIVVANVEINNLRANITAANLLIAPVSNLSAIVGNLIPITSNTYNIGSDSVKWKEIWTGGNIQTTEYVLVGKDLQVPLVSTGNINANTALIYEQAIVGNIRTLDNFGVANLGNIITSSGIFWANGENYSNAFVTSGNLTFTDTTIGTAGGASNGIILNSAGAGEIAMLDYVGINNTNPGYWLHIGDGSPGTGDNTGNISIDFRNNTGTQRGSTILGYAWWDSASTGTDNRGTGPHSHFGIYKNDDTFDNRFIEFNYTSGNANVGNLTATSLTVLTNVAYTMANYQNWTSNVSTVGAALDQLAQRLKDAGF
jgi:hypothetical protein